MADYALRTARPDYEIVGEWATRLVASDARVTRPDNGDRFFVCQEIDQAVAAARAILAEARRQCATSRKAAGDENA